jgi:hypothetical protein
VSSRTWTLPAVASEAKSIRLDLWRAVEAQHEASTMSLVDSLEEQLVLERVLEQSKPAIPEVARRLDYLLFTPFRYLPPPGGSRFRAGDDPGVFYAADLVRTACAELGYWRWRHLLDTPNLPAMPQKAQTVFRVRAEGESVDLRDAPFARDHDAWSSSGDYSACQRFARVAREGGIQIIRYESVRDPGGGGCAALMTPYAFARPAPLDRQTWMLSVFRERVVWQHSHSPAGEAFEFPAEIWTKRT